MAFSLNRAQIIGNLTRDPEVRMAGSQKVATFSVATNFVWTDQSGQKKEKAEFHNIVTWRRLAEICEQYLKKGQKVYVEGRMQTRDWEGEDGIKRYRTEIVAENLIMLGQKSSVTDYAVEGATSEKRSTRSIRQSTPDDGEKQSVSAEEEVSVDDLPF